MLTPARLLDRASSSPNSVQFQYSLIPTTRKPIDFHFEFFLLRRSILSDKAIPCLADMTMHLIFY